MTHILRDYQIETVQDVRNEWAKGNTRTTIVHATGLGKGDVIAKLATDEVAAGEHAHVLLIAHRSELLDQMTERCKDYNPQIKIGRVQADDNEVNCPITVASVQTLARPKRRGQLPRPTLLIIDEAHHSMARSYQEIMQWAGCFDQVNPTRTLGVTATLVRGDGQGFGRLFQSIADTHGVDWAIRKHWLVEPHGRRVPLHTLNLRHITTRHGDYADNELGASIGAEAEEIVRAWLRYGENRITVVFTPTKAAAAAVHENFKAHGVAAEIVVGTTPTDQRTKIYQRLEAGTTRVLVSVMVTTEGWDCPPCSCVMIARPTQNRGLYTQMVGRGLRLSEGKKDCLILDVVGLQVDPRLVMLTDMYPSALYIDQPVPEFDRQRFPRRNPYPTGWARIKSWLFGK